MRSVPAEQVEFEATLVIAEHETPVGAPQLQLSVHVRVSVPEA
jgi:hypothetical protein